MRTLLCKNVSYDYVQKSGITSALRDVSAEFHTGTMYSLTGRSGSGKTTLLSILAGFDRPKSGEILLDGQSIAEMSPSEYRRENIGIVFQSYNLIGHLTAEENVCLTIGSSVNKKERTQYARTLLAKVGLSEECFKKYPLMLSGGEQQRVAVARAVASGAPFLLADEPTGNLDNENSRNIISLLKNLAHDEEKCVIVVTHSDEVAVEADVHLTMADGFLRLWTSQ